MVGTSGSASERARGNCQWSELAGPDMLDRGGHDVEHYVHLAAKEISDRRSSPAIGNVNQVDIGHHLEQLTGNMGRGAIATRSHVELARVRLCIGDEIRDSVGRN